MMEYPKRIIEVDLPIKRISANARKEKSIRQGHISTLHIWWARRPLAACRAVLCASLWPDPADLLCPPEFIYEARKQMINWATNHLKLLSTESINHFVKYQKNPKLLDDVEELRNALLDFIADFSKWDNSINKKYLETSRSLTKISHQFLNSLSGTKPLVVDPFAGGGAIPFEALKLGASVIANDLNPIPFLLNKVILSYIPKSGEKIIKDLQEWGEWIKTEAKKELNHLYPEENNTPPLAYIWSRFIYCGGPKCGKKIPLIRNNYIVKKNKKKVIIEFSKEDYQIIQSNKYTKNAKGTIKGGNVSCPYCGYTTGVKKVREELRKQKGGTRSAELLCIITNSTSGYIYNKPSEIQLKAIKVANKEVDKIQDLPQTKLPPQGTLGFRVRNYGMDSWTDLFNSRQLICANFLIRKSSEFIKRNEKDLSLASVITLVIDRIIDSNSGQCWWVNNAETCMRSFGRQTVQMIWDYSEINPFYSWSRGLDSAIASVIEVFPQIMNSVSEVGETINKSATEIILPDESVDLFFTDPPYYDAIPYADLSDFYYIWHLLLHSDLNASSPKKDECIVNGDINDSRGIHNEQHYLDTLEKSFTNANNYINKNGIGVVVFAHKSTSGWESILQAIINSNWVITASWPIDTESSRRLRAQDSAALASSVHLVCRPRLRNIMGDWRDILNQLPKKIKEWMTRLQKEGIVGADAIFACLGPALEIFSQFNKVEKASGKEVSLKEYLEYVWAAIAKEALNMIFENADASGFEEDSRLTAMWLWTLFADKSTNSNEQTDEESDSEEESNEESSPKKKKIIGYALEYDAARKIAQGLGIHLENLKSVVEVKGETATLLSVGGRAKYLFAKEDITVQTKKGKKKAQESFDFMKEIEKEESDIAIVSELARMNKADTTLDKLHQTMLLFAANRGEAMKRLLVEEGFGRDNNFWKLAQALSALYPKDSLEKRWVDGVLMRKKGLGF